MTDAPVPPFSAWEREIAFRYLRARRSEGGVALSSIISFLAIMLAVAVLIIVMSVMNGFRSDLSDLILGFNGHDYIVAAPHNEPELSAMLARVRAVPHVVQAIPVIESQTLVQSQDSAAGAIVRGVRPADLAATGLIAHNIKAGSLAEFGKGEDGGDEILMGARLADGLDVRAGDTVTLISPASAATALGVLPLQKTYVVGGLFKVGMSEYDQGFVYMPLAQARLFFGRDSPMDYIMVTLDNPDLATRLKPELAAAAGPGAVVTDWTEKNQAYFGALEVEHNVMFLILSLLVVIASLNIISALVMLVKNKGRDIAILRTMGAGQGAVMRIFVMCGAIVGVLGTLAGLAVGVLFCWRIDDIQRFVEWVTGAQVFNAQIYFLSHLPAKVEWSEVLAVTVIALAASFLTTLWPSWRAARLDPVEALRYE
jgi:lipoprotein-releasing system permease protein